MFAFSKHTAVFEKLFAAVARWTFIGSGLARAGIWLSPIVIGMLHDRITRRRIYPVYAIGSIVLFLFAFRLLVASSEAWLRIGRPVLDARCTRGLLPPWQLEGYSRQTPHRLRIALENANNSPLR